MKHFWLKLSTAALFLSILGCAKRDNIVYFQGDLTKNQITEKHTNDLPVFKVGDLIDIKVSSLNMEASSPFNLPNNYTSFNGSYTSGNPSPEGYLIDYSGHINFPVLGKIKVAGRSRNQIVSDLQSKLSSYLNSPIVHIRITNFKITVLGDVSRPGSFTIPNERITIPEALGIAGDLQISGKRNNIKLIRDNNGVKEIHLIDLTRSEVLNSPFYYLEQNDVIYVEPNRTKMNSSLYSPIYSLVLSATALIITTINVLTK